MSQKLDGKTNKPPQQVKYLRPTFFEPYSNNNNNNNNNTHAVKYRREIHSTVFPQLLIEIILIFDKHVAQDSPHVKHQHDQNHTTSNLFMSSK